MEKTKSRKKTEASIHKDMFTNLPTDIFFDILVRLPLKTISNCRWVNKTWYASILNPRFAQLHYSKSLQTKSISALFRSRDTTFHIIEPESFYNFETSAVAYPVHFNELEDLFKVSIAHNCYARNCYDVVGFVNGLVCFSPETGTYFRAIPYYICNPVTREYVTTLLSPNSHIDPIASGFGFDSNANEYKVIRILLSSDEKKLDVELQNVVEVYSLGSRSWREIPTNIPYITGMRSCPVFIHGCLHWVAYINTTSSPNKAVVVSFNPTTEDFNLLQLSPESNQVIGLLVLDDCLCSVDCVDYGIRAVWKMKEYGDQNSWAKKCTFGRGDMYVLTQNAHGMGELRNGEMLLLNDWKNIGYYHPQKRRFKTIMIHTLKEEPVAEIDLPVFQVGSLFSPKNMGRDQAGSSTEAGMYS